MNRIILLIFAASIPAGNATAASARSPDRIPAATNDLQRAVWACEAGAQAQASSGDHPRFFLGLTGGDGAPLQRRSAPPLILQGGELSGVGEQADHGVWSTIRFACTLSGDLRKMQVFKSEIIGKAPGTGLQPPQSHVARAANAAAMIWYMTGRDPIALVHGARETDDQDFHASCAGHSGALRIILTNTVPWLRDGDYVLVSISSGKVSGLYVARGVMDENLGVSVPDFVVAQADPLAGWLGRETTLLVNVGSEFVYEVSLAGSARPARLFASACRH